MFSASGWAYSVHADVVCLMAGNSAGSGTRNRFPAVRREPCIARPVQDQLTAGLSWAPYHVTGELRRRHGSGPHQWPPKPGSVHRCGHQPDPPPDIRPEIHATRGRARSANFGVLAAVQPHDTEAAPGEQAVQGVHQDRQVPAPWRRVHRDRGALRHGRRADTHHPGRPSADAHLPRGQVRHVRDDAQAASDAPGETQLGLPDPRRRPGQPDALRAACRRSMRLQAEADDRRGAAAQVQRTEAGGEACDLGIVAHFFVTRDEKPGRQP